MRWVLICAVLLACLSPGVSAAADLPSLPEQLRTLLSPPLAGFSGLTEDTVPTQVTIGGTPLALETFATRPDRPGRYPMALLIHGAEPASLRQWATTLASRGWLAVVIAWPGYYTDGSTDLNTGTCDKPDAGAWLDRQSAAIEAAARALGARADADPSRLMLFGVSEGGLIALNTAARGAIPVSAVIVASGALRAWTEETGPVQCAAFDEAVTARIGEMGGTVHAPALWFQSVNDTIAPPALADARVRAFARAGGDVRFEMLPRLIEDGHNVFVTWQGQHQMLPVIDEFLRDHKLPTWNNRLRRDLLARLRPAQQAMGNMYLREAMGYKALAIGEDGTDAQGWHTSVVSADDAIRNALSLCEQWRKGPCHIVAVDNNIIPEKQYIGWYHVADLPLFITVREQ